MLLALKKCDDGIFEEGWKSLLSSYNIFVVEGDGFVEKGWKSLLNGHNIFVFEVDVRYTMENPQLYAYSNIAGSSHSLRFANWPILSCPLSGHR